MSSEHLDGTPPSQQQGGQQPRKQSLGKDLAGEATSLVVDATKQAFGNLIFNALIYGGLFLAVLLPVAGVAVGVLSLIVSVWTGRSWFVPIVTLIASVFVWIFAGGPLGLSTALFARA